MDKIIKHGIQMSASLDPSSQKELRATLETIFSESGNKLDFNTPQNRANIENLAKAFQSIFAKAGDASIDFGKIMKMPSDQMFKELGTIAATRFWDAWNAVAAGASSNIGQQLDSLIKERERLLTMQTKLQSGKKKVNYYSELNELASEDEVRPFSEQDVKKLGKTLDDAALRVQDDFTRAEDRLSEMTRGTTEYQRALINAYEAASNLYRMSGYIQKHSGQIQDKSIIKDYDGGNLADITSDLFNNYRGDVRKLEQTYYEPELAKVSNRLTEINAKIQQAQQNRDGVINDGAIASDLSSLNKIEEAYQRILNAHGKIGKKGKNIQDALSFDPAASKQGIQSLYDAYVKLPEDSPWEVQYQALLKYVRLYESYLNGTNQTHKNKITTPGNDFTKLYDQIKPLAANAEKMLQGVLDMANIVPKTQLDKISSNARRLELTGQLSGVGADATEISALEANLAKRKEIFGLLQQEGLLTDEIRASYNAVNAEIQEKITLLKQSNSNAYTPGSLLNNPLLADMFGKAKSGAEKKQSAVEGSAAAAKDELNATKQTTTELEKQQKLLLYRRVDGVFDPNRISSRSTDALYDKSGKPIIQQALASGFGGFGDGLYGAIASAADNLIPPIADGKVSFFEFDASKYNLFINRTVEQAEALRTFLLSLQKFVGAGTLLDPSQLTNISDLSQDQLFEEAQKIFKNFSMSKSQFDAWIASARQESEMIANMFSKGQVPANRHNFGTRFMQTLGYEGVLNATGDAEYDGNYHGSVIYDPDVDKIRQGFGEGMKTFANADDFEAYLERRAVAANNAAVAQEKLNTAEAQNPQTSDAVNVETQAIQQQNSALQENIKLKEQSGTRGAVTAGGTSIGTDVMKISDASNTADAGTSTPAQTASASTESARMEELKAAVDAVKASVELKTQAFINEEQEVQRVITSEISSLNLLEQKVGTIKATLEGLVNNIRTGQSDIGAGLGNIAVTVNHANNTDANLATESTLISIKATLDAINGKIVVGTKGGSSKQTSKTTNDTTKKSAEPSKNTSNNNDDTEKKSKTSQSKRIDKLRREIGARQGELNNVTNEGVRKALEEEIALRERIIQLIQQGSAMSVQEEARQISDLSEKTRIAKEAAKEEAKTRKEAEAEKQKVFKDQIKESQQNAKLDKAQSAYNTGTRVLGQAMQIDDIRPEQEAALRRYNDELTKLNTMRTEAKSGGIVTPEQQQKIIAQTQHVNGLTAEIQELILNYERLSGANSAPLKGPTVDAGASSDTIKQALTDAVMLNTNGRASIKGFNHDTKELSYTVKDASGYITQYTAGVRQLDGSMRTVRKSSTKMMGVFETLGKKIKAYSYYFTGSMMVYRAIAWVREGITAIKDIDVALTELKKVTDETEASYENFLDTAAKTASKVGSTIKEIVSSTADWARLGYSMKEATELATSTQILMNVSEFTDISAATDSLISSIQAFKYTAEESMDVVDILNTIGNNYAISTADLAKSLTKSSGSLVAANGTLEEAVALTASANTIIQDADVVGTALKTVAMRIRGTTTEELEEEGLDSDGLVTQSKLRSKIKGLSGVDILTDDGAYKSTYQILADIAEVWEDMNDMDQAALLELLAGKRAGSVMSAILEHPETLRDAFESANNASGSALKENEKYLDSIQGKLDLFKNAVQTMWSDELSSGVIGGFVEFGTILINVIDKVGLLNAAIIALVAYIKISQKMSWGSFFTSIGNSVAGLNTRLTSLATRLGIVSSSTAGLATATTTLTSANAAQILSDAGAKEAQQKRIISALGLSNATKTLTKDEFMNALAANNVGTAEERAALATLFFKESNEKLSFSFKSLGSGIKKFVTTNKLLFTIIGIVAAITAAIKIIGFFTDTMDELKEEFTELESELEATESKLKDFEDELKEINDQIEELNTQPSLSFTDKAELDRLKAQSSELERQIGLTEMLRAQQQKQVNNGAIDIANEYKDIGMTTGQTTEENMGTGAQWGAGIAGAGLGIAGYAGAFASAGAAAGPVGAIVGALIGLIAGAIIGMGAGAAVSAFEDNVGDSLDNMKSQYDNLKSELESARASYSLDADEDNKEDFEEAQKALDDYQAIMSDHLMKLDAYYKSIDLSIYDPVTDADELNRIRQEMNNFYDTQDKWAIQSGGKNAKLNAIDRIFGVGADDTLKSVKKKIELAAKEAVQIAKETGNDIKFDVDLSEYMSTTDLDAFAERLYDIGIYVNDVEAYFKDLARAEAEAGDVSLYGVVTDIHKISEGLEKLQSAFNDVLETSSLTTATLMDLNEVFGDLGDSWDNYVNAMFSGVSSTKEMKEATEALAKAFIDSKILTGEAITQFERMTYIIQLRNMGVENAEAYVDDKIEENAYKAISNSADYDWDSIENGYREDAINAKINKNEKWKSWDEMTEEERRSYAEWRNYKQRINAEDARRIADEYGVEIDNLQSVIDLLDEQREAEIELAKLRKQDDTYKTWQDDLADATAAVNILKKKYKEIFNEEFNIDNWKIGITFFDEDPYWTNELTGEEYVYDKDGANDEATTLIHDLWWAIDELSTLEYKGSQITPADQDRINELNNQLAEYTERLEKELTLDVKLELGLVNESDLVDDIQNVFDSLSDAVKEYNENGYLTVDTAQALTDTENIDPKYLTLLEDENGQLSLTKENLYQVAIARLTDLKVKRQDAILTEAENLAKSGSVDKLRESTEVLYGEADALQTVNKERLKTIRGILEERKAKGELVGFDINNYMTNLESQVDVTGKIFDSAISNIQNSISSSGNTAKAEADDAFKRAMEYWEHRIAANQAKYEQLQNEIDLLESKGQKADASYYEEQIKLENERLSLLKQQKAEAQKFLGTFAEGSDEWFRKEARLLGNL